MSAAEELLSQLCRASKARTAPSAGNSDVSVHTSIPSKHPDSSFSTCLLRLLLRVGAALMSRERLRGGGAPSMQLLSDFMSLKKSLEVVTTLRNPHFSEETEEK